MKRIKRLEINKRVGPARVRVSRTSAPNVAVSPAQGVTLNSAHGLRLSRGWRGFNLALQNKRVILRGRWSDRASGLNMNMSKSGVSVSKRTALGTFNFVRPNRSSASFAGIQLRGKNAAIIAGVSLLLELAVAAFQFLARLLVAAVPVLLYAANLLWALAVLLGTALAFVFLDLPRQLADIFRSWLGRRKTEAKEKDDGSSEGGV